MVPRARSLGKCHVDQCLHPHNPNYVNFAQPHCLPTIALCTYVCHAHAGLFCAHMMHACQPCTGMPASCVCSFLWLVARSRCMIRARCASSCVWSRRLLDHKKGLKRFLVFLESLSDVSLPLTPGGAVGGITSWRVWEVPRYSWYLQLVWKVLEECFKCLLRTGEGVPTVCLRYH